MTKPYVLVPNPHLATDVPNPSAGVTTRVQHPRDIPLPPEEEDGRPLPRSDNDEPSSHIHNMPTYPTMHPIININKGPILDLRVWEKHLPGRSPATKWPQLCSQAAEHFVFFAKIRTFF